MLRWSVTSGITQVALQSAGDDSSSSVYLFAGSFEEIYRHMRSIWSHLRARILGKSSTDVMCDRTNAAEQIPQKC